MKKIIKTQFPLNSIQSGAMLGNGKLGLLLWGQERELNITIGCAELWDHCGGFNWTAKQNYNDIVQALAVGDKERMKRIFALETANTVKSPSLIPVGRIRIILPDGYRLAYCEQYIFSGLTRIVCELQDRRETLDFYCRMSGQPEFACRATVDFDFELIPSWELYRNGKFKELRLCHENSLEERGFSPPRKLNNAFIQPMPADANFGLAVQKNGDGIACRFLRDTTGDDIAALKYPDFQILAAENHSWWYDYWGDIPEITLSDPQLEEIYFHGLYKFGIMTNPQGTPAGLQGPWIEDDRCPPWSGDYHFNINVEMCYSPALRAGKFKNIRTLLDMILGWKEQLRRYAEYFVGIPDGYLLPYAVDDRGRCISNFWTGCIDHGCTAWVAQMMFDYCEYTGDTEFLHTEVFDFMRGAMRVFEEMSVFEDSKLVLPVSVSPEYGDAAMNAWGKNASFQLAAIRRLAENLITAAEKLNMVPEPFWVQVIRQLPPVNLYCTGESAEIALWENKVLEESHRHHSHLAGITPFDILDLTDSVTRSLVGNSLERWTRMGMGEWTGWALPWASMIHTRCGNSVAACHLLHTWKTFFCNKGGGSLHDARVKGFTIFAGFRGEIMQMDGAMGAVAAIQEMLMHSSRGVLKVFYGIPEEWENASFCDMPAPGGFRISGVYSHGRTRRLEITASHEAMLAISVPDTDFFMNGDCYRKKMHAGEKLTLRPASEIMENHNATF